MNKTKYLSYSIHSEKVLRNHIIMEVQIWYEYAFRNGFTPLCKYYTAICSSYLGNWIGVRGWSDGRNSQVSKIEMSATVAKSNQL